MIEGPEGETLAVAVEATLHHRDAPGVWSAFMKPGKRIKAGDRIRFGAAADGACLPGRLDATVVDKGEDGLVALRFDLAGPALDEAIRDVGVMPLPPISPPNGPRTTATGRTTRHCSRNGTARSPRRRRACISPRP